MGEKRKIDANSNTRENDSDDDVSNEPIADFSLAFNGLDMEFVVNTLLYNVFKTFTVTKVEKILSEGRVDISRKLQYFIMCRKSFVPLLGLLLNAFFHSFICLMVSHAVTFKFAFLYRARLGGNYSIREPMKNMSVAPCIILQPTMDV